MRRSSLHTLVADVIRGTCRIEQNLRRLGFALLEPHLQGTLAASIAVNDELDLSLVLVVQRLPE